MKVIQNLRKNFKDYFLNILIPIVMYGGIIGIMVGLVVWAYSAAAEAIQKFSLSMYATVATNMLYLPLLIIALALIATLVYFIFKVVPEIQGSGVPYTEGVMRGLLTFRWQRVLFGTIICSFLTYLAGLPLGSEGPSIQIGGTIGHGLNVAGEKLHHRSAAWRRLSITGGASAGIAVAFNAPLTGIVFALEEGHKRFSPMILLTAASSVLFATVTSRIIGNIIGRDLFIFDVNTLHDLPISNIYLLIILGVVVGLLAALFSFVLFKTKNFFDKYQKIPPLAKLITIFVLVGIVGVFLIDAIGTGGHLVKKIANLDFTLQVLIILFLVRLVLVVLSVNSGATGGMFVPVLALGAIIGGIVGLVFMECGMPSEYYKTIVIIGMCAFMGSVLRSPLTAIILTVEVTGQLLTGFLSIGITIILAYFIVELLGIEPMYDFFLSKILKNKNAGKKKKFYVYDIEIEEGSFAVGKSVRDILWPPRCIVLKIQQVDSEGNVKKRMDNDGERKMVAGARYTIQTETEDIEYVKKCIDDLVKKT